MKRWTGEAIVEFGQPGGNALRPGTVAYVCVPGLAEVGHPRVCCDGTARVRVERDDDVVAVRISKLAGADVPWVRVVVPFEREGINPIVGPWLTGDDVPAWMCGTDGVPS